MTQTQPLVLRAHPFAQPGVVQVLAGQTIRQMLTGAAGGRALSADLVVRVGGAVVPVELWDRVRPKTGACITVTREALAGGGDGWKQVLGVVVLIAVSLLSYGWGSSLAAVYGGTAGAWAGAITMVASLAVSALLAPPSPSGGGSSTASQWNQLTGTQNQINPWGVIPLVIGESIFYPPHAALPYSEMVGEDSYQHCLFDLGYGDLEVSDIKIGDTPIGSYSGVQYEITTDPTLYRNDVSETSVAATLADGDAAVTRTTAPGVESIGLNFVYPQGLFGKGTGGGSGTFGLMVAWSIRYRPVGSSTWLTPASPRMSGISSQAYFPWSGANFWMQANRTEPFSTGIEWDVAPGQYEVQVQRLKTQHGSSKNTYVDSCTWTILRSIKHTNPSRTGTNKLAMRIKANDQLTGTLQTLSCRVKQRVPVYDRGSGTWSAPTTTTSPAWCVYWLMTSCAAVARHAPVARMDLDGWADYADFCTAHGFKAMTVVDSSTTMLALINSVLGGSLASLGNRNGLYTPVFDRGEEPYSMAFTPLEMKDFKESRSFTELPQALRVQFKNPDAGWAEDEIIVLDDGYSYRGVDARGNASSLPEPARYETLKLELAMPAAQAWQLGRYHFAQAKFRPSVFSWGSDVAGLGTVRGDVVQVAHDVVEWGAGWGRVVSVATGAPTGAATLVLDQEVTTDPEQSYSVQIRTVAGVQVIACTPSAPQSNVIYLASMPSGVQAGDAVVVGVTGNESMKLLITGVTYSDDLASSFSAVAYDARVLPYWSDPPAGIVSEVSGTDYATPVPPVVTGVVSSPVNDATDDAGIAAPSVLIGIRNDSRYEANLA